MQIEIKASSFNSGNNSDKSMIIVADSGSTKTAWRLINDANHVVSFETPGINPYYQNKDEISSFLEKILLPHITKKVSEMHFYGAGCTGEKTDLVREAISSVLGNILIEVQSDLLGAARALCFDEPGIVCILGTGSNSCFYNGRFIEKNIPPLGFILGDEGSAAVLGKRLVADYLKHMMPEPLKLLFEQEYGITVAEILNRVYRTEFPNRYLSGFAPFLSKYINHAYCETLVISEFQSFVERNLMSYSSGKEMQVHFTGSVAFYFQKQIMKVLQSNGMKIGKIVQHPIDLLTEYHRRGH